MPKLNWCQNSTWHGIPDLYNSESGKGKLFWLLSLLLTSTIASWQVGRLLTAYFSGSSYSTSEIIENLGHLPFPNVTVCSYNRANQSRLAEINLSEASLDVLMSYIYEPFILQPYWDNQTNFTSSYEGFIRDINDTLEYRKTLDFLGHDCEVSLLGCWFYGWPFDCCSNVIVVGNVFGKCFSINPPSNMLGSTSVLEQTAVGWGTGLQLMINPGLEYYSNSVLSNFLAEGNVLLINDVPTSFDVVGEISLQPGKHHNIVVIAESSRYADPEVPLYKMPCSKGIELEFYKGQYSNILCSDDCQLQNYRRYCDCIPEAFGSTLNYTLCGAEFIACVANISLLEEAFYYLQNCTTKCGERCEPTMHYKASLFQTDLAKEKMSRLKNKFNWPGNPDKYIYTDIHYDTLGKVIKVTSEKTSFFDLVSNIGGQLSLWCGMSFISFVQIIYYTCNCCSFKKSSKSMTSIGIGNR